PFAAVAVGVPDEDVCRDATMPPEIAPPTRAATTIRAVRPAPARPPRPAGSAGGVAEGGGPKGRLPARPAQGGGAGPGGGGGAGGGGGGAGSAGGGGWTKWGLVRSDGSIVREDRHGELASFSMPSSFPAVSVSLL